MTRGEWRTRLVPGAKTTRPVLVVALVGVLAGLMFAVSARLQGGSSGLRHGSDLVNLVEHELSRVERLTTEVEWLRAEVDRLAEAAQVSVSENESMVMREGIAVGTVAVSGPALRVEMDDAPPANISIPGITADDLVIHQQDIQHVINALWAGGAEAMTLQGERITMTSAFRCSGNILLLHGRVFSPPYIIEAIGDVESMRRALDDSPGVQLYLEWADRVGLGWSVRALDSTDMPAYSGSTDLKFAALPPAKEPLR